MGISNKEELSLCSMRKSSLVERFRDGHQIVGVYGFTTFQNGLSITSWFYFLSTFGNKKVGNWPWKVIPSQTVTSGF